MTRRPDLFCFGLVACLAFSAWSLPHQAVAQEDEEEQAEEQAEESEDDSEMFDDVIFVTGSRTPTSPLAQRAPVVELSTEDIQRSGLTNLGTALQQLPSTGSAINSRFNVPGNSGFPQDGNGIGAGAINLALRNLGAKRTLVLVDGKRWVPGASASGVPIAVDINSIPANVVERIEVLQDGASAIYGSDAIAGVVNIITKQDYRGMQFAVQTGEYLDDGDGDSTELSALWGGGDEKTHIIVSASYYDEGDIKTSDRAQSAFPNPFATSCDVPGTLCSSFTPQGRFILGPNFDFWDGTLNEGVLNDGGANIPVFDPNDPNGGDFNAFDATNRFNYNGQGFNFLITPSKRLNIYSGLTREITDNTRLGVKLSYTNRKSSTRAAPEPLCLGAGCGNRINDNILIHRDNPYNPFGVDLSVANGNLEFFGRRPLESGPRLFDQDVDTYFGSIGLDGNFTSGSRSFFWDVSFNYGENRGFQQKRNSHNAAKLAIALGDPDVCAQVPNCVPFNFFGGQGPNGTGSITQPMLDFVTFTQRDFSEQDMVTFAGNITGDLAQMPNGSNIAFAVGAEYRELEGSFQPDPIAASGETAGIPSAPTAGGYDVTEFYAEVNFPLMFDRPMAEYWELNVAGRYSDYSTFGGESTYKIGTLWQPTDKVSLRATISTGLRAPGIGELFGGAAREDFTKLDPCADVLGQFGSDAGGRDEPQPQNIIDNCASLGISTNFTQRNPQLSAVSAGNATLTPEESDNISFGAVYSPGPWSVSLDFYDLEIDNAVQGQDPADVIDACVETLDPFFCDLVERAPSGAINLVDNQLQNIGGIEASGWDLAFSWTSQETDSGRFAVGFDATWLDEYLELTKNADGSLTVVDRTGTLTDETFMRGFPELRWLGTFDWYRNQFQAGMTVRWVDEVIQNNDEPLDSVFFTDLRFIYTWPYGNNNSVSTVLGFNNIFDEDPPTCTACGVIGMSQVLHDLPGTVGYIRFVVDIE